MSFRRPAIVAAAALATALTATATPALAAGSSLTPPSSYTFKVDPTTGSVTLPSSGEAIPNVDSVKSAIRAYYNASGGLADRTSSSYISEVSGIIGQIEAQYPALSDADKGTKAIVFDTDDTLLWNYDYEDKGSNFNYNGTTNAQWVTGKNADNTDFSCPNGDEVGGAFCFPAVPGTPALVKDLAAKGYALYVVTGRPASQKQATIDNLKAAGFTTSSGDPLIPDSHVFTKWETGATTYDASTVPDYIKSGECSTTVTGIPHSYKCTTVEYKAQTREHIEDADGVEIVGNVGDQLSDLWGGYANKAWKIPNPTYFLASPNLDAVHIGSDDESATLQPATTYTMAPLTTVATAAAKGDGIPNIDPVRAEIRAYYNAPSSTGIADKTSSAYITEVTGLMKSWSSRIATDCKTQVNRIAAVTAAHAAAPAVVAHTAKMLRKAKTAVRKAKHKSRKAKRRAHRTLVRARANYNTAKYNLAHPAKVPNKPAIVLDSDDTTLWNYDMEDGAMKFVYDAAIGADWTLNKKFPAVPGSVALAKAAKAAGCTIIGVTGRTSDQAEASVENLTQVGFVDSKGAPLFTPALYFTKWLTGATTYDATKVPSYINSSNCSTSVTGIAGSLKCTTQEYKSATRKHIENDLHYDIVGNLGDQYSDLVGGFADKTYKVPNPTYYLWP
ncbi:HAD family acid phosphatase [Nocardioides sp. Kera G14]|uniref:HAD family acid phosphatase n=1 Tax=Nocardioides sp. Kera G14 TaxID=2884264 RepID=UPI001D1208AF|nr:HAD family acid phosphatase [Nocardioides sp. Kera G14]UDY24041.1 hypothetical protein LH076_01730 [Nocardioides sp. Kera G14]